MVKRCIETTDDGDRCSREAMFGKNYCWQHLPSGGTKMAISRSGSRHLTGRGGGRVSAKKAAAKKSAAKKSVAKKSAAKKSAAKKSAARKARAH